MPTPATDSEAEPTAEAKPKATARRRNLDLRLALNAISDIVQNRPLPIRTFDQIYMKIGDMIVYAEYLCRKLDGKTLVFVGDGDAIGLSMAHLRSSGVLDYGPKKIMLLDFDERMVNSVVRFSEENGFTDLISAKLYNVAEPVPNELLDSFDCFHINPPWGQYNDGRSVVAFLRRGVQLIRKDGLGVVAIADDRDAMWASGVLAKTQRAALDFGLVSIEMQPSMHTYHLDDAPELASCTMLFRAVDKAVIENLNLSPEDMADFYGRGRNLEVRYVRERSTIGRGTADPEQYDLELMNGGNDARRQNARGNCFHESGDTRI